jgi:predicted O-linked N-acetylglucosamine transferase (SPINDLY family)
MTNDLAAVERALASGVAAQQAGRMDEAEQAYRAALELAPGQGEALYLMGLLQLQRGQPAQAEQFLAKAVAALPQEPNAHYYRGEAFAAQTRYTEAIDSFGRAIALKPDFAQALVDRGLALESLGRTQEAIASFDQAIKAEPGLAAAHFHRGAVLMGSGQPIAAIASFDHVVALEPDHVETWFLRAMARQGLQPTDAILADLDHMIARHPPRAEVFLLRANARSARGQFADAVADYGQAIALQPDNPETFVNRGNAQYARRHLDAALADYDRAIALKPDLAEAFLNRGNVFCADQRLASALADYDKVIALKPSFAQAYLNRATTLAALKRPADALADCDQAIALAPGNALAFAERANLLAAQGRQAEAVQDYRRAISLDPRLEYVQGGYLRSKMHLCDWSDFDADCAALSAAVEADIPQAFSLLFVPSSAALQHRCAVRYVKDKYPAMPPLWRGETFSHDRIRLAYLSGTFRAHPTTVLMGGLFARHDKAKFETIALSFGPDDGSPARRALQSSFDQFLDVAALSDRQIAERVRALEIDILIDLDGYIEHARTGILAHRAAPVQVNYLGYPGTLGAPYMDYILADPVVIPPGDEPHYAEKIARLPDSYQPNSNRPSPAATPSRASLGLPENAFVFCSFNNHYKITPDVFAVWMRLLDKVPGSVLWLLTLQDTPRDNLRQEAAKAGIDPARLVFAGYAPPPEHLARLRQADLFLDTLYYNAHTTASDALWMGLPLVTCRGQTFAGRVAASLLHAAGLPELVTENLAAYEALALRLAQQPDLLRSFKDRLTRSNALFDQDLFLRHLEAAYETMAARARRGEKPSSFTVAQ